MLENSDRLCNKVLSLPVRERKLRAKLRESGAWRADDREEDRLLVFTQIMFDFLTDPTVTEEREIRY